MNRIVTRGLGPKHLCVTQGFAGDLVGKLRELLRLCSPLAPEIVLRSECKKTNSN
jgi:hypothetical protein